ncbi:uncharacterized protein LOC141724963 [Apium graveolens]|uniref:uncharacterized protein LOC141724963 n=1 Tax=Apium graveolens TaxID=4045 RepID=UPI003D79ECE9
MMQQFGFHQVWVDRLMHYITSVKYSFIHNGVVFGNVIPERGLRQADPISPYIYIMCVEGLSSILRRNEQAGLIHGCRIARCQRSHTYYLQTILINYDKSAVTFSTNTKDEDRVEVCNELEVQRKLDPVCLIKARYYANTEFLEANLGANPSFMWRSIMTSQEIVKQHCRRKIGDGRSTRVWHIPWLPSSENGCLTTTPHADIRDIVVQNLMGADLRSWDMDILNDLFNERDIDLIEQIPIPIHSRPDSWYWLLDDKGLFTVKSCYISIRGEHLNTEGGFVKFLWKLKFPGKIDLKRSQDCVVDDEQRRQWVTIRRWCRPPEGWVKINIDAACRGSI